MEKAKTNEASYLCDVVMPKRKNEQKRRAEKRAEKSHPITGKKVGIGMAFRDFGSVRED